MHVFSKYNVKTPEDKFTPTKILFSIFKFVICPSLIVGLGGILSIQSCHSRVTFISHRDAELTLCWSCAMCVLCPDLRPKELRKTKTFSLSPSPVWFPHTGSSECCLFC